MATVAQPLHEHRNHTTDLMNLFESCATGFFGPCEDTCQQASRTVFWEPAAPVIQTDDRIRTLDFQKLHDQFLESMLHEAAVMGQESKHEEEEEANFENPNLLRFDSSMSTEEDSQQQRKRRRPLRLTRRRTPPRLRKQVSPLSDHHSNASTEHSKSSSTSVTISLSDLSTANLPKPETYLHELVRMQKDKGKGEPVGSNLCAKGREACLEKLRDKMRLLTEVATEKAAGATMKLRKARISERIDNFVETRSLLNLKMGFLSITYGVLLRWDTTKTGTITLVVLRKMCHESFYPQESQPVPAAVSTPRSPTLAANRDLFLHQSNNVEFISPEPPYCVPRPVKFTPALLSVSVVSVTGLSKKSNWTMQLSVDDTIDNFALQWDSSKRYLSPKAPCTLRHLTGDRIHWGFHSGIQVKLFENRIRRRSPRRLTSNLFVPLANLKAQRSLGARQRRITVPCTHDPEACIVLDIAWQSDHALWVPKEIEARRYQTPPPTAVLVEPEESEELENQDPWDWICHIC